MSRLVRAIAVAAGLAAAFAPAASAEGASLFQGRSGGADIEVHADARRIFYLRMYVPISCGGAPSLQVIADTRVPIRLDRQNGSFSYVDIFSKGNEYDKAEIKGTIRNGRLRGTYAFGSTYGGYGPCFTGDAVRGTPQHPEGSPVPFSLSHRKGVRFYEDRSLKQRRRANTYLPGSFPHVVYMWIGHGKVFSLTAIVRETCITHQSGFPPSRNVFDLVLAHRQAAVNRRTHEIRVGEVKRTGTGPKNREVWKLHAQVGPDDVVGALSYVYDYRYAGGDTLHCQTGGESGPVVDFNAHHR